MNFQISFSAPSIKIVSDQQFSTGFRVTQGSVAFRGRSPMAYSTTTTGEPFTLLMEGFGPAPENTLIDPLPVDFPTASWTGFDLGVVTFTVAPDTRSVACVLTGTAGNFTVTANVPGFEPATIDIDVAAVALAVDHIGIRAFVTPAA